MEDELSDSLLRELDQLHLFDDNYLHVTDKLGMLNQLSPISVDEILSPTVRY